MFEHSIPKSVHPSEWVVVPVRAIPERLVPLNGVREDCLSVKPFCENQTVYIREMVMNLLVLAAGKLPNGVKLEVKKGWLPDGTFATGGVVEVRLVDEQGNRLEMGDEFALRAYDEKADALTDEEEVFLRHRRLLYHSMSAVGFVAKPNVWWHFEFGTQYWAAVKEKRLFMGRLHLNKKTDIRPFFL